MGMVFAVAYDADSLPPPPKDFASCGNLPSHTTPSTEAMIFGAVVLAVIVLVLGVFIVFQLKQRVGEKTEEESYLLLKTAGMK